MESFLSGDPEPVSWRLCLVLSCLILSCILSCCALEAPPEAPGYQALGGSAEPQVTRFEAQFFRKIKIFSHFSLINLPLQVADTPKSKQGLGSLGTQCMLSNPVEDITRTSRQNLTVGVKC